MSAAKLPGARPERDSESALAAWRAKGEGLRYFPKGLHNLSGQEPGYMIVKLGLAAADGPGAAAARRAAAAAWARLRRAPARASWLVELPAY